MNKKEFIKAYRKFYPHGQPDSFCEHVFRVFDADGNGFIGRIKSEQKICYIN